MRTGMLAKTRHSVPARTLRIMIRNMAVLHEGRLPGRDPSSLERTARTAITWADVFDLRQHLHGRSHRTVRSQVAIVARAFEEAALDECREDRVAGRTIEAP
jgi:hypothetical protein